MCYCDGDCRTVYSTRAYMEVMTMLSEVQSQTESLLDENNQLKNLVLKEKVDKSRIQHKLDLLK